MGELSFVSDFLQYIVIRAVPLWPSIQKQLASPSERSRLAATSRRVALFGLDGSNKGVYTRNMEREEVDFVACRQCVCSAARRRSRDLTRAFEKAMRGSGMRGTQFTLLATLVQTGPIPTTRLADFQGLERTTLTRNLRLLVRDGFVRIDEGEDRRVRKVTITPAGEEAARRALSVLEEGAGCGFGGGAALGAVLNFWHIGVSTL